MCGILASSKRIEGLEHVIEFLHYRGPDLTNHVEVNGVDFVHTLLSMTGPPTPQPFISDDSNQVALFNGEIYNYRDIGDYDSDGFCILPLYEKYGTDCIKHMDGEFAVAIVDFKKRILLISTDVFSIKPLWFAREDGEFALSSYQSCITRLGFSNPVQIEANSTYILDLDTLEVKDRKDVYTFDLNQHKDNFDDWGKAFENSIAKRTKNIKHGVFIGLSSGYDSGAIACELEKQNLPFTAYSIIGSENPSTIDARISRTHDPRLMNLEIEKFLAARNHLKKNCEEYYLAIDNGENDKVSDMEKEIEQLNKKLELPLKLLTEQLGWFNEKSWFIKCDEVKALRNKRDTLISRVEKWKEVANYRATGQKLTDDNGAVGMGHICARGRKEGQLIYLSGSGADEIFSDYGFDGIKHFRHSTIGGSFPEELETVFPWKNFFGNTQRAYLMKEEHVSGTHGIEGRYPFLDKQVVQEFLWLKPELKNANYKSVLHWYMEKEAYPFDIQQKVGFNCGFSFDNGEYSEKKSTHRIVGEAIDDSLIVNWEREISRTPQRRKRRVLN
ncbi:asparagine synthase-related protein [Deltaproteobacteria bacterium]|nr:asparagine synthase-related protein [Deltaproteobacteria bacterium]